jgi:hypothetical protein
VGDTTPVYEFGFLIVKRRVVVEIVVYESWSVGVRKLSLSPACTRIGDALKLQSFAAELAVPQ